MNEMYVDVQQILYLIAIFFQYNPYSVRGYIKLIIIWLIEYMDLSINNKRASQHTTSTDLS